MLRVGVIHAISANLSGGGEIRRLTRECNYDLLNLYAFCSQLEVDIRLVIKTATRIYTKHVESDTQSD